ncbi:MAG TPA: polysaccharide deacetylase [Candidatus Polarisedimenticolia bacterium]|nr:polysaccharide deacetylase [Candidatus Polarisedimenticolia bacterium]
MNQNKSKLFNVGMVLALFVILGPGVGVLKAQEKGKTKTGAEALPGINWSVDQLKQAVAPVRPGRVLLPVKWPNNARVAVVISVDADNETFLLAAGNTAPAPVANEEYGATEGLPRILAMLDRLDVPCTFFTPAVSTIIAPQMIPQIMKSGKHEIALHGWIHESVEILNDPVLEEKLMVQAIEHYTKETGKKPVGSRTGSWQFSSYTMGIEQKLGLLYDSSLMAMDVPYELMSNGKDTGVVELPVTWVQDDYPYFVVNGSLPSPELIFQVYKDEFEMAYREGTFLMLTFHPQIERRSRILYMEQLIAYMKTKPGVWFATAEQVAKWVKSNPTVDSPFGRMQEPQ